MWVCFFLFCFLLLIFHIPCAHLPCVLFENLNILWIYFITGCVKTRGWNRFQCRIFSSYDSTIRMARSIGRSKSGSYLKTNQFYVYIIIDNYVNCFTFRLDALIHYPNNHHKVLPKIQIFYKNFIMCYWKLMLPKVT